MPIKQNRKLEKATAQTRRFEDLGLNGGSGDGTWTLVEEWFESDDAEFSLPFSIVEAFEYSDGSKRPKYGYGVTVEDDETKYYIAFPAQNSKGEIHKKRKAIYDLFQDDKTPIEGCVMQRIDTGQEHPFIDIISVEQMERIISDESPEEPF